MNSCLQKDHLGNDNLRRLKKHDNFLAELRLELGQSNKFLSEDNQLIEALSQKVNNHSNFFSLLFLFANKFLLLI